MENTSHFLFKCPKFNAFRREIYCSQLAIMLNHRKLFSCLGMIHYQMKVMKSFSEQFINIYSKPNDFHQIIRLLDLTWKWYVTVINKRTYWCSTTLITIVTIIINYRRADFFSFLPFFSYFFSFFFYSSCFLSLSSYLVFIIIELNNEIFMKNVYICSII